MLENDLQKKELKKKDKLEEDTPMDDNTETNTSAIYEEDEEDDFSPLKQEIAETDINNNINSEDDKTEDNNTADSETAFSADNSEENNNADNTNETRKLNYDKLNNILKSKKLWITAGIVAGLFACAYFGGAIYYRTHFFNGTIIQGYDCSNMTVDEAEKLITDSIENYEFKIKERNGESESIKGTDIDLDINSIGKVSDLKAKQNPLQWLTDRDNKKLGLDISLSMNEEKLAAQVENLKCVSESRSNMQEAVSQIIYQSDNTYSIPDDGKNVVSEKKLFELVRSGMYGLYNDMDLEEEGCYVKKADEDKMKEALSLMNQYVAAKVTYNNGDNPIVLDGTTTNTWIKLNSDYTVSIDEEKVGEYVKYLASVYNTIGTSRPFTTSNGNQITISGGDYGWWVNTGAEKSALIEIIKSGQTTEREPIYFQTAATHGNVDIGNTYVEIDLSAQHLWYYHDGAVVVSTDFVSGDPTKGYATPTGVYSITYKERNATLKGEGYSSPVNFWMPFNGGVGLHDASWRSSFGGSIYNGGGSHGCINLPYSAAQTIFGSISKGDPVIVY